MHPTVPVAECDVTSDIFGSFDLNTKPAHRFSYNQCCEAALIGFRHLAQVFEPLLHLVRDIQQMFHWKQVGYVA